MTACRTDITPPCGTDIEHIEHQALEDLPNALTRLQYHTQPIYDDPADDAHYALVDGPEWMRIDAATGALTGEP